MKRVSPDATPSVETEPERADAGDGTADLRPIRGKLPSTDFDFAEEVVIVSKKRVWQAEPGEVEQPVKIISYMGSLSDEAGKDGDFYLDEMTNMLYGPKTGGVWPEEGVSAAGLCKRTWIGLIRRRATASPVQRGFLWRLKAFFRFWGPAPQAKRGL